MTFALPDEALAQHIAILGKTGSGKTYTAKGIVEQLLDQARRVCIVDPTGVWWGLRSSADGNKPGFPAVVFGGDHADVPLPVRSGPALAELIGTGNVPAIVDVSEFNMSERHLFMEQFAATLHRANRGPLHLVIDEADEFAPQNPLPESKHMLHEVDRIVRRGRVRGFRVTLISQRPAVLHKNVLTQAATLIAMRLPAIQDRKAVEAWIKGVADEAQGKEVLASLPRLQKGEGWVWAPEWDVLERVQFPRIRTFDSGRAPDEGDEELPAPKRLAAVELEGIATAFAAFEEEAKANDPKLLREEIAELKRQLKAKPAPEVDEAALDAAYESGFLDARKVDSRVASNVIGHYFDDNFENWNRTFIGNLITAVQEGIAEENERTRQVAAAILERAPERPRLAAPAGEPRSPTPAREPAPRRVAPTPPAISGTVEQRILRAIATLEAMRAHPARQLVAMLAGYSHPRSKAFVNALGSLRTAGKVDYPNPGIIALTDAGRAEVGRQAPLSIEQLQEQVIAALGNVAGRILRPLISAYPGPVTRDDLARAAGYEHVRSKAFVNALGGLRTMGFVVYPSTGAVAASPVIFGESS